MTSTPGIVLRACLVALVGCGARTSLDVMGPFPEADGGPSGLADSAAPLESAAVCGDGGPREVSYVLGASGVLYRYDVATRHLTKLGAPACGNGNIAWTMTASRDTAYIVYTDWTLYAVDLATLGCSQTPFRSGQLGLDFQFGIAAAGAPGAERLYFCGQPGTSARPILAVSDVTSFVLTKVGDIAPQPPTTLPVNLTADAAGHLYAFSPDGFVQQIDPASGAVLQGAQTGVTSMGTWATLAYAGDLHLWVQSEVIGYDLASHARTSDDDAGVYAIGGSSVPGCP